MEFEINKWLQALQEFIRSPISSLTELANFMRLFLYSLIYKLFISLVGSIMFLCLAIALFFFAVVVYLMLYHFIMPISTFTLPVYFDFSQSNPSASINLLSHQWVKSDVSVSHYSDASYVLTAGQMYNIDLDIDFGGFVVEDPLILQVTSELFSSSQLLASSSRPIPIQSHYSGLLFHSFTKISTTNRIIEFFIEDDYFRASNLRLVLSRSDIPIKSATVHFTVALFGLRYYIHHYFITGALVGISQIFLAELIIVVVFILLFWFWRGIKDEDDEEEDLDVDNSDLFIPPLNENVRSRIS